MIWIVRILFGVKVNVPKDVAKKISSKFSGHKRTYAEMREMEKL